MTTADDFQILDVLNSRTSSDLFLVKKKATGELFVWRTILLRNIPKEKKDVLCNRIQQRIQQEHPLLVKFCPIIEDKNLKLIYVPIEYFPQGNILEFIKKVGKSDKTHINEVVVVKFLFQLLTLLKGIQIYDYITLKNVYLDEDFNVKFLNFSRSSTQTKYEIKMCDIGNIIMQMCTLTTAKPCNKYILKNEYYSSDFIILVEMMLKDNKDVNINIDKIIGHPVILFNTFKLNLGLKLNGCFEVLDYMGKLELLRKKDGILKLKEHKLERKEHALNVREKKITISEKAVKDKLTQAELYLRRCKESKPSQTHKYENIDTSLSAEYEELECSHIIQTSKKMNMDKIEKPFIRTFSERKVRFKGHSPLKEMDFHRGKSLRKTKAALFKESTIEKEKFSSKSGKIDSDLFKDILNTDKPFAKPVLKTEDKKRRSILFGANKSVVQDENVPNMDCHPIGWTEENKKHAFDLLRIMNATVDRQFWTKDVKHTYL